jgi:Rrf2 family protein
MLLSARCEYAIRAVLDLALAGGAQPVRIAEIATRQKIPQKFLEAILADLKRDGLLESRRGAEGGYRLGRPAEEITVGRVVRAIEGSPSPAGGDEDPLGGLKREVENSLAAVFDHKSFAELAREWRDRQTAWVPSWDI